MNQATTIIDGRAWEQKQGESGRGFPLAEARGCYPEIHVSAAGQQKMAAISGERFSCIGC